MTHYWWMHWFWITSHLALSIVLIHSTPLAPPSTIASQLEIEQNQNYSYRPINFIDGVTATVTITNTSSSTIQPLATKISKSSSELITSTSKTTSCLNQTSDVNVSINTTELNCNKTISSDSLQSVDSNASTDSSNVTADVTNNTVIVTESKELISKQGVGVGVGDGDASSWNAMSITGVCFGLVACAAFITATSVVLYRRRYLNKPQTLNDKCSNPDSSGYIDDSTMRENSEEMYSLDNDSFLNSLEAMTIQNYWTDSVKHTKL